MQFASEMSEMGDLYVDYSEDHAKTHVLPRASLEDRQLDVLRVLDVQFDPVTRKQLPQYLVPSNVIQSRVGHTVYVESFAFKPTSFELLAQIDQFLKMFISIIERYQITSEHYLVQIQQALHFAFGSVTSPNTQEKFFEQKRIASDTTSASCKVDAWKEFIHHCQIFLDNTELSMVFKEIKMNADGHVVLRMTINQAHAYLEFRNAWQRLFSENYQRYTEPEKITTLASVLGVINLYSLPKAQRTALTNELNDVFLQITESMRNKSYAFNQIELSEASNRMLQEQDMLGKLTIQRGYVHCSTRTLADKTSLSPQLFFSERFLKTQMGRVNRYVVFSMGHFFSSDLATLKNRVTEYYAKHDRPDVTGAMVWEYLAQYRDAHHRIPLYYLRMGMGLFEFWKTRIQQQFPIVSDNEQVLFNEFRKAWLSMCQFTQRTIVRINDFIHYLEYHKDTTFILVSHTNHAHMDYIQEQIEAHFSARFPHDQFQFITSMDSKRENHPDTLTYAFENKIIRLSRHDDVISCLRTITKDILPQYVDSSFELPETFELADFKRLIPYNKINAFDFR